MKNNLPKEKGQGLVEYALILVLVAIVIILVLNVFTPGINYFTSQSNKGILSTAPVIYESGRPVQIPIDSYFVNDVYVEYGNCLDVSSGPYYIKVGTTYSDPNIITVSKSDSHYAICNNLPGTSVQIIYALYKA